MVIDLFGDLFGEWTVLKKVDSRHNSSYYLCPCKCGVKKHVRKYHLTKGLSKSCGCLLSKSSKPKLANANKVFRNCYSDGNLSFDEFIFLSQQPCHYCGVKFSNMINRYKNPSVKNKSDFVIENGDFYYNGLDRKNSDIPHNRENVVPCCVTCNYAKHIMNIDEFRNWIEKVYNHFIKDVEQTDMLQLIDDKLLKLK